MPSRRLLIVAFDDGASFALPAELLRVMSPSAEVQGHSPEERVTVPGKKVVRILRVESPSGRSTFTTVAPKSARYLAHPGPATTVARSITRNPRSGSTGRACQPGAAVCPIAELLPPVGGGWCRRRDSNPHWTAPKAVASTLGYAGGRRDAGAGGVANHGPRSVPRMRAGTGMSSKLSTVGVTSISST